MDSAIKDGAKIIIKEWLSLKENESILIVTDDYHIKEALEIKRQSEKIGAFAVMRIMPLESPQQGKFFDNLLEVAMEMDVIVGATTYSFITTKAVKTALSKGSRFLSLPLHTKDGKSMLAYDFIKMDPQKSLIKAEKIVPEFNKSKKIRIITDLGTDIEFDVDERKADYFTGAASKKSDFASASFEVYIAPNEEKTNGKVVIDGAIGYIGKIEEPFEIQFENGRLIDIDETKEDGRNLKAYMESFKCENINVAGELGIGLNELSKIEGNCYIEDESVYKTFHIGLGRNISFGGKNYSNGHFDIIVKNPNVYVDEKLIIKNGELIIN